MQLSLPLKLMQYIFYIPHTFTLYKYVISQLAIFATLLSPLLQFHYHILPSQTTQLAALGLILSLACLHQIWLHNNYSNLPLAPTPTPSLHAQSIIDCLAGKYAMHFPII